MKETLKLTEKQETSAGVQRELSRRIQQWGRDTHNHRETRRNDSSACCFCQGSRPQVTSLCDGCQGFSDISHLIFCKLGRLRNHLLGSLEEISSRNSCSLCDIISTSIGETWHSAESANVLGNTHGMYSISGPYWPCGLYGSGTPVSEAKSQFHEYRALYRIHASSLSNNPPLGWIDLKILLAYPKDFRNSFNLSRWESLPTDLSSTALHWVERCKRKHQAVCETRQKATKSDLPLDFRVIDIHDYCIVSPPKDAQYLALSYVWGPPGTTSAWLSKSNMSELRSKDGLAILQLPRTIREAMDLTSQLKFRYLWVDALCIVQDPPGSDEHQVRAMDAIYHFAQITIVAAAGSDANAGLPGFGVHPRPAATHNSTREPDELYREWYKPNFRTVIPASTWSNRGWTLQEQLLSKRCLLFTKHQIYFQCRCSTIEEEYGLCFEVGNDTRITDVPSFTNLLYNFRLDNQTRMQAAVTAFTSRQLTHSADVLNAFAGITNALNFLASGGHSASSIESNAPVHFTSEYTLPHTLCFDWRGLPVKRPRVNYPSWHWSAWLGPIEFPFHTYEVIIHDPYVNHPGQGLKRYSSSKDDVSVDEVHSPELRILAENMPWTLLIRAEYATQSSFYIAGKARFRYKSLACRVEANPTQPEGSTRMRIASGNVWVGTIDIKNTWISTIQSPTVQLGWIALVKHSLFSFKGVPQPYLRGSSHIVIVMMVCRDSNGYCSRLGIGEINHDAWRSAKPETKSILLV